MQIAEQKEEIQKCSVEKFNFQAEITSLKYLILFSCDFLESSWQQLPIKLQIKAPPELIPFWRERRSNMSSLAVELSPKVNVRFVSTFVSISRETFCQKRRKKWEMVQRTLHCFAPPFVSRWFFVCVVPTNPYFGPGSRSGEKKYLLVVPKTLGDVQAAPVRFS